MNYQRQNPKRLPHHVCPRDRSRWTSRFSKSIITFAAAVVLCLLTAQASRAEDELGNTVNYAFATQLGSGIYNINGRIVQIYRITGTIPIRSSGEGGEERLGLRLRVPLTIGFYDFRVEDIVDTGLPENIGTLALVPELEFELPRKKPNWRLLPFGGFGGGKDFQGGDFNFIFTAGIRSLVLWPWRRAAIRLANRLVYSGYTTKQLTLIDDFGLLETGLDLRRPLGFTMFGKQADASVFGANYLYLSSPQFASLNTTQLSFSTDWEIGVTFGTTEPIKILGIGLPRLGLSYRFEPHRGIVRFVIGDAFPITPARAEPAAIH